MKRLIDKITGTVRPEPPPLEDSQFFSTLILERADPTQVRATWAMRASEVGATDLERGASIERFCQLWDEDRHLAALRNDDLERMCTYLIFAGIPAKREVVRQDEQGDYMLVILEGGMVVERQQTTGGRARLAEAGPGDILGEMSLLDAGTRFSYCTTLTPVKVAVLDAKAMDRMLRQDPRLAAALVASLARRLSLSLRQVSARLSALLPRN